MHEGLWVKQRQMDLLWYIYMYTHQIIIQIGKGIEVDEQGKEMLLA